MQTRRRDVTMATGTGAGQSGAVGATLGTAFTVNVKDRLGANYPNVQVEWSVEDDSTCTPSASLTDASGNASMTLMLGSAAGTVTITARVGRTDSVTFTATKTAASAASIAANSVTDQSGTTSATVTTPPSVLVTDAQGNPVSGVSITWAVTAGGGSVNTTGATTTNASGAATLTSWTLGASAGLNTVTATSASLSGSPVTFNANASAALPTQIAVQSGGAQTGVTAGSAATATVFRVRDAGSAAVQGVTVSFTVTTGSGTLSVPSAVTNASGDASVTYTTHTTVETATITGSFTNASGTVVSVSTTIASAAGAATKLAIQTQPSSNGSSDTALTQQPIILIQDANGNTKLTDTSTVTASVQSGNATITGNTKAAVAGVATFSALTLTDTDGGVNILRFSDGALTTVDSTGTVLAPPVPALLQFGVQPGAVTAGQSTLGCSVYILDSGGGGVPGATNAVTVALTTPGGATLSGTLTVNAVAGVATFTGLSVNLAGSYTLSAAAANLTGATSSAFNVTAPAATNEPTDVTMASFVNADLSTIALDTAFTNGGSYVGMTQGGGNANMTVRLLSDQSWRTAGSAIPTCPAGDRVLVCAITPNGSDVISAGEKGLLYKSCPSGTKTLYLRWYGLVSSNWYGQAAASFKKFYFRCASTQPAVFLYNGAGTANVNGTINWQTPNTSAKVTASGMTRNVWALWEVVAVCPTTAGGTDGHFTVYKDGVRVYQRTDMATGATTWGEQQFLNYYGGTGNTTVTAGNGTQYSVVGDGFYFSTSASRAAVPA